MGLLSFGKKKSSAAPASPYDWTTLERDPLTENPRIINGLMPWQQATAEAGTAAATRLQAPDSPLYGTLEQQAGNELALGGELSDDEARAITQDARASYAARGMGNSALAGFHEVLRRAGAATQRRRERQQNAAGIYELGLKRRAQDANVLQTAGVLGNQANEFAEDTRRFDLNRFDTRQFNRNSIQKDLDTANKNASAAKSAGKSSLLGGVIGGVLKLF